MATALVISALVGFGTPRDAFAQDKAAAPTPTMIRMSGTLLTPSGAPRTGAVVLVASIYADAADTAPLWTELEPVTLDAEGRYAIFVGSNTQGGIPKQIFVGRSGKWMGIGVQGEPEQGRTNITSIAYADKAVDADTLGGKSASDFVLANKDGAPTSQVATANYLPKYTDSGGTLSNSIVYETAGKIGIGTTTPGKTVDVVGDVRASGSIIFSNGAYGFRSNLGVMTFDAGSVWPSAFNFQYGGTSNSALYIAANGRIGVGTISPAVKLDVRGGGINLEGDLRATGNVIFGTNGLRSIGGVVTFDAGNYPKGFNFQYGQSPASALYIAASGNVGVGTTTPSSKLDVAGSINVTGNINAKYQDVAEWVEAPEPLEPGTVVIIDPSAVNQVVAASKAYDTRVAGAVSAQPGLALGEKGPNKELVAQGGRVRVKVDAQYGEIHIGDILVTSDTPGYAMVSKPIDIGGVLIHRPGTILGKALEAWTNGKGEILVLLGSQ